MDSSTPTPSPSLGERILSTVEAPDRTEAQLQTLLQEIDATPAAEKPKLLDALKQEIAGLDATKRADIQTKLDTLQKESFTNLTEAELNQLHGVTDAMRAELAAAPLEAAAIPEPAPTMDVPAPPPALNTPGGASPEAMEKAMASPAAAESVSKNTPWFPRSPNPREWSGRQIATMATATLGFVGLYALWRKWKHRNQPDASGDTEPTKKGWNLRRLIYWIPGVGLAAVAAYVGGKAILKQVEKMGLRKLQKEWANVQEQLKNVGNFTEKEFAELKQKREELEEKMKAYLTQPTAGDAPTAAPVPPAVVDRTREVGAEAVETGTEYAIASGLARFCPSPDWALVNTDKQRTIYGIMQHPANATLTVADIVSGTRAFAVGEEHERTAEDNRQATELLRTFCTTQKPKLIDRMMKRDGLTFEAATAKVDAMPFVPFIKQVAFVYTHAEQAADILQRAYENRSALMDLKNLGTLSDLSEDLKMQLRTFMEDNIPMTEEEKASITTESLVRLALHQGGILLRAYGAPNTDAPAEEQALYRFVTEEAATRETATCMLPFFHKVFLDPDVWSESNMEHNLNVVTAYMQDWMTVDEVLRLYLYRKMIEDGNPAGVVLMQAAVLKYVTRREYGGSIIGLKPKKYDMMQRIAGKFTASGMEEFSKEWENLDPAALEQAQEILGSVLSEAGKGVLGVIAGSAVEAGSAIKSAISENPKTAITAAVVTPYAIHRYYTWMEKFSPGKIQPAMANSGKDWLKTRILHWTTTAQYQDNAARFTKIFRAIETEPKLLKYLEECCKSQGGKAVWEELFRALKMHVPPLDKEVIDAAEYFTKNQLARDIVANTRMIWNSIPGLKRFTRALGSAKNGVVSAAKNIVGRIPVPAPLAKVAGLVKGTVVLDTLLVGTEAYNYFANERPRLLSEIEGETDPAKKAQLERELSAKGFIGGPGLVGGQTFNTVGTGLLYSPLMPVGVAMIASNAVGQPIRENIEEGTTYMLKTEKELEQETAGQILQHIGQTAPGQFATWGQGLAANPAKYARNLLLAGIPDPAVAYAAPDMSDTFDEANEGARMEGYRAYYRQTARMVLPPFTKEELSEADQKLPPADIQMRVKTRMQDELGYFATSALTYLREATRGHFTLVDPVVLRKAELYAKQCTLTHRVDLSHPESAKEDLRSWAEKQKEIDEISVRFETMQATDIASLSGHPTVFAQQAPWKLLLAVRHELAACETKILAADYSNWSSVLGGNWQSEENLRAIARGAYAERALTVVRDLVSRVQSGTPASPEQIIQTIAAMRLALVDGNPNDVAFESIDQHRDASYEVIGNNVHLLSFDTMWALIQATLPPAPAVTPARPAAPASATQTAPATAA